MGLTVNGPNHPSSLSLSLTLALSLTLDPSLSPQASEPAAKVTRLEADPEYEKVCLIKEI